ncbi:MAG: hypothetical protein VCB42_02050 [Myxococcota bacterium]
METEAKYCTATKGVASWLLVLALAGSGCHGSSDLAAARQSRTVTAGGRQFQVFVAPPPPGEEQPCAWYGAARDNLLYFGEAAFWNALRRTDQPTADLAETGAQRIGRFRLAPVPGMLPPIPIARDRPSGVWDVFPHSQGRLYFTTFFESAGYVDPETGEVRRFTALGTGLNEWAAGPGDSLLVSRYAADSGERGGSVLWIDPEGNLLAEMPLHAAREGSKIAPKTVAWDPMRNQIWVTTDVIPQRAGPDGHPTLVLDMAGRERLRVSEFEIQFVRFGPDGTGYLALAEDSSLFLAILEPGPAESDPGQARRILLDPHFARDYDFTQDLELAADGRVIVTTWSGGIHVVDPREDGTVDSLAFPRLDPDGLYYTAVLAGNSLCATYCSDLAVVCTDLE